MMKKESKAKQQLAMKDAYQNPFKPENIEKNKE